MKNCNIFLVCTWKTEDILKYLINVNSNETSLTMERHKYSMAHQIRKTFAFGCYYCLSVSPLSLSLSLSVFLSLILLPSLPFPFPLSLPPFIPSSPSYLSVILSNSPCAFLFFTLDLFSVVRFVSKTLPLSCLKTTKAVQRTE